MIAFPSLLQRVMSGVTPSQENTGDVRCISQEIRAWKSNCHNFIMICLLERNTILISATSAKLSKPASAQWKYRLKTEHHVLISIVLIIVGEGN